MLCDGREVQGGGAGESRARGTGGFGDPGGGGLPFGGSGGRVVVRISTGVGWVS